MPNVVALSLSQGETLAYLITVANTAGVAQNITGCEIHLVVRELDGTLVSALSKRTGFGIVHAAQAGATLGQATITWLHADSAAINFGIYKYVIYVIDAASQRQVIVDWSPFEIVDGEPTLPVVS